MIGIVPGTESAEDGGVPHIGKRTAAGGFSEGRLFEPAVDRVEVGRCRRRGAADIEGDGCSRGRELARLKGERMTSEDERRYSGEEQETGDKVGVRQHGLPRPWIWGHTGKLNLKLLCAFYTSWVVGYLVYMRSPHCIFLQRPVRNKLNVLDRVHERSVLLEHGNIRLAKKSLHQTMGVPERSLSCVFVMPHK